MKTYQKHKMLPYLGPKGRAIPVQLKFLMVAIIAVALNTLSSCKKLIQVDPQMPALSTPSVFKDSVTVQAALAGLYAQLTLTQTKAQPYRTGITTLCGMSADEFQYIGNTYDQFIYNNIPTTDQYVADIWASSYANIYIANSIIEGVTNGSGLSARFKGQAIAEATFIRSFIYFHLVNIYGAVPLLTTTDVTSNANAPRIAAATVYQQIITDLKMAQSNLSADYSVSSGDRTRANKWAATALLAKAYLYTADWVDAEAQATAVINTSALYALVSPAQIFLANSKEAILQFYNDGTGYTAIAAALLPNLTNGTPSYILTPQLIGSFEAGDNRRTNWVGSTVYAGSTYYYSTKYRSLTPGNLEYNTPLRLADIYLVRAEARAKQANITGSQADIFAIRNRAGLGSSTAATPATLLLAIEQERRIELNCEWGNRFFDLKRTGRADAVLGAEKPTTWKPTAILYPIPSIEIGKNSNMVQNPGY